MKHAKTKKHMESFPLYLISHLTYQTYHDGDENYNINDNLAI